MTKTAAAYEALEITTTISTLMEHNMLYFGCCQKLNFTTSVPATTSMTLLDQ